MGKINFFRATEAQYNSIVSPDKDSIYFITDRGKIYVNGVCYSSASDQIHSNYIDVLADSEGYLTVSTETIPISVQFNGKIYDLDDCVLYKENDEYKIDTKYFLIQANLQSYNDTYRVWQAGGKKGKDGEKGEDGTGISNITEDYSDQDGGINQVIITTSDGNFYTIHIKNGSKGDQGTPGVIQNNYIEVQAVEDYILVPNTNIPVAIGIQNSVYDIDSVIQQDVQNNTFKIYAPYYLAKHNIETYSGLFKVWLAGGEKGEQGPKGDTGEQGPKGDTGDIGPSNVLTIGTVQKGDTASATITGESPSQVLNLVLPKGDAGQQGPKGDTGDTGPSNVLTIGTVQKGDTASATITGTSPSQVLNLVLPKGDAGQKGDKGDTGQKGDTGDIGPSNVLTIGTVQKGDTASATITGTSPSQVLNLVLPKGDTGQQGPKGDTGQKGDKGDTGQKGDTGEQGPKGDTGQTGPQGPKGDTGQKGDKGDTGQKGDKGDTGQKGDTGDTGPSNVLTIGTVDSGDSPSATITGISPSQVLNLVLPKGDTGQKGDKGDTGQKGDTGGSFVIKVVNEIPEDPAPNILYLIYQSQDPILVQSPLTFTAVKASSKVGLNSVGSPTVDGLQYRTNTSGQWLPYTCGTTISLANIGDTVQFKNSKTQLSLSSTDYVAFSMTGQIEAHGNIQSMLNYSSSCTPYCYYGMFSYCASLTTAPQLPAITLAQGCYRHMFFGCESLTTAPQLPATTLANGCYRDMFHACESLTTAPQLPATTLASYCYYNMFNACTYLEETPQLPATTLASYCYCGMFSRCTSLTETPQLPATKLTGGCYGYMFKYTSINYIKVHFTEWLEGATIEWMSEVSDTGTFTHPASLSITEKGTSTVPEGWNTVAFGEAQEPEPQPVDPLSVPLTLTAVDAGSTVKMKLAKTPNVSGIKYKKNTDTEWQAYTFTEGATEGPQIILQNEGDSVQFMNTNTTLSTSYNVFAYFAMTGKIEASGNVNSMLNFLKDEQENTIELSEYCYTGLFKNCTSLATAPELPATTLAPYCYFQMFFGCESLTTAPQLPATTLAQGCYYQMFFICPSLTTAPQLPATTLVQACYYNMFLNCSSLDSLKVGFTQWFDNATQSWLQGVSNTGTFTHPASLSIDERGPSTVPEGWNTSVYIVPLTFTAERSSSVTLKSKGAPIVDGLYYRQNNSGGWQPYTCGTSIQLSDTGSIVQFMNTNSQLSTSLSDYVYFQISGRVSASGNVQSMLNYSQSCTPYCFAKMFNNCIALASAPELPATTLAAGCYSDMFYGCTSIKQAPQLPAAQLANSCYDRMFWLCVSLNYIKVHFTEWLEGATTDWVFNVYSTGTFVKPTALPETTGASNIPEGWTITNF